MSAFRSPTGLVALVLSAYSILLSIATVYAVSSPLIVYKGSVDGVVSLVGYRLTVLGEPFRSPMLDFAAFMTAAVYVASAILLVFSVYTLSSLHNLERLRVGVAGVFAGLLSVMIAYGLVRALIRLVVQELSLIRVSSLATTAGKILFPPYSVELTAAYHYLASSTPLMLVVPAVILASILMVWVEGQAGVKVGKKGASS